MKKTPHSEANPLTRRLFSVGAAALLAAGLGVLTAKAAGPPATPQGMITHSFYNGNGTGNTTVATLTSDPAYPNSPNLVDHPTYFESWASGNITIPPVGDAGEGYGDQIQGYFYAPTNGNYTFWIASDDNSALYLSTDSTAANAHLIAQVTAWANVREYGTESGTGTVTTEDVSSTFTGTQWPTTNTAGGATIALTAGQVYYIEALHKEGGGGDDLSVSIDGALPIPGSMLSSFDVPGNTPTVVSVTGSAFFNSVTVVFSQPLEPASATTLANYSLSGGLTISAARLATASAEGDSNTVVLTTSLQPTNTSFTLTINNVTDVSSNAIAKSTTASFKSYVWVPGWMTYEQWDADPIASTPQTFEQDLTSNLESLPSWTAAEPQFDGPWIGNQSAGQWDDFNSLSFAWFTPSVTTNYTFFVSGDDASDLFISPDGNPAHKVLIAQEAGNSGEYDWQTVTATSAVGDKCSSTFSNPDGYPAWPTLDSVNGGYLITLTNGQSYYMEIDHHEGAVTPGGAGATYSILGAGNAIVVPAQNATGEALTGNAIGTYLDTSAQSLAFNVQPANSSVVEGNSGTITATVTASSIYVGIPEEDGETFPPSVSFQWQEAPAGSSTFTNIPGAIGAAYDTGTLFPANSGEQFRVIVSLPGVSQTSSAATVTVTTDTTPPVIVSAGALPNTGNPLQQGGTTQVAGTEVSVIFSKPLAGSAVTNLASYSLNNGATVLAARYVPGAAGQTLIVPDVVGGAREPNEQSGVILTVTNFNLTDSYELTVTGVQDIFGISIAAGAVMPVAISPFNWISLGVTVTNNENLDGATNEVIAVGTNSFNLINGGNAYWGTEDDVSMVYETVKGDFDRTVQVEWSDPASHWARAGISARATINPGDVLPIVNTTAPVNIITISDPETNAIYGGILDSIANNQYEGNYRAATGGATAGVTGTGTSSYPGSWVRLKRVGQFMTLFYSHDTNEPQTWYPYGEVDFSTNSAATASDTQLPDELFVGPTYGCENGNILGQYDSYAGPDLTGHFTARFRNYSTPAQKPRGTATMAIGLKFACDANINGGPGLLLSTNDIAGVAQVAQGNWNDLFGFNTNYAEGTIIGENETTGKQVQLTNMLVGTIGVPNLWTTQGPGADANQDGGYLTGEDAVMMTGYLDSGAPSTGDIGITNIPPEMVSAGYDVIVYSQAAVNARGGGCSILDTNLDLIPGQGVFTLQYALNPTGFIQAVGPPLATNATTVTNWPLGNFLVFTNLKASAINVQYTTATPFGLGGTMRAEVNAIQLISPSGLISSTPPPPTPTISVSAAGVITYSGVLRTASNLDGPWTPVSGATSPYTIPAAGGTRFFAAGAQ
jgi:hypothetical protein